ncbi:MAG: hypothetical protein LBI05_03755 [Planctomycetaceae bacterium]|jgi:hypothetical protein|nr:hypothetical protein [Planctomycetaceae bacterium]
MKKSIILSTLLGMLIVGTVHAQSGGDGYVSRSLQVLLAARTIDSNIRIETFVDGKEYAFWGNYAEQALPRATQNVFMRSVFRLELSSQTHSIGSTPNQMTLVCYASEDGEKHQIEQYTVIEGNQSGITIDVKKLENRLKAGNREIFFSQASELRKYGGLAGMMRQISRFYEFSLPTQENLQGDETVPAWKLTGTLRNIHRKELLTRFGGLDSKGHYPKDFPSDVELWIGRHNDFPYKVRYLRRISEKSEQKELLFQEAFYKVTLNGTPFPLSDARFAPLKFPASIFSIQDYTDSFIKELGL